MAASYVATLAVLLPFVFGTEVTPFQFPWVAGISRSGANLFSCSGALIDAHWVLTSANCQVNVGDTVHLNRHDMYDFAEVDAEKLSISEVVRHPKYNNITLSHNIALLRVCSSISSSPVQLSNDSEDVVAAMIAGWGTVDTDGVTMKKLMKLAKAATLPLDKCAVETTDSLLCAQISDSYVCRQLEGTPLFSDSVLVGIYSQGAKDCEAPRLFSRVDHASEWIQTTIQSAKDCDGPSRHLRELNCGAHQSCGMCAGEQSDGSFCYWCASSQTCYSEQEWLDDEICNMFSTQKSDCGISGADGTNSGTNTQDGDEGGSCGDFSSCKTCAGQEYQDGEGKRASCFWCGEQQACISAAQWEAGSSCSQVSFGARDCKVQDKCSAAASCGTCLSSGFTDVFGAYQSCVWCGSQCVGESRVSSSSCPNPQKVCMPRGGSAKTCSQLGWSIAPGNEVCGASQIRGQCSYLLSYSLAKLWCQEAGARLCTGDELNQNVAAFTGCKLDQERSWTSDTCANGHITQAGSSLGTSLYPPSCDSDSTKRLTRCCADQPGGASLPSPQPRKSCSALNWDTAPSSPLVCAQSVVNGMCINQADFLTAQTSCWSLGARLCSASELEANEAKNSGCKLDNTVVWSSTSCSGGVYTTTGAFTGAERTCEALTAKRAVRCCSDIDATPGVVIYRHSCEDLGWLVQPSGLCASSKVNGQCATPADFGVAKDHCTSVGARICTADELEAGIGGGSGCKLDDARVWTSTKCQGGSPSFISMAGHPSFLSSVPKECTPGTSKFSVRCCSDSDQQGPRSIPRG